MGSGTYDPRMDKWAVLEDAKSRLLDTLRELGVERIEYVVGFVRPYRVSVWLGTGTDAEKAALAKQERLSDTVAEVLAAAGPRSAG